MKSSYESLKEIGVDVDEIWRKMLGFGVCIGLLPLILIISWNEIQLWRFERNWSWCWWDMKENVRFWSMYRVVTPYFDHLMKWNPVMKVWKFSRNWSWCWWDMKENVRFWSMYRVVTPYFDHLMKWNPVMKVESLKEIRVDVDEIWRKMLGFGVRIGLLPIILIISWNEIQLWKFERNWSWCWWDMKKNVRFWSKYRVITPYFDCLMKWNPVMKVWKKSELMLLRCEGKC